MQDGEARVRIKELASKLDSLVQISENNRKAIDRCIEEIAALRGTKPKATRVD